MEGAGSSETSISIYQTTWYHIPENSNPYIDMGTKRGEILSPGLNTPLIPYEMLEKPVD
jgi:hypothetical protein